MRLRLSSSFGGYLAEVSDVVAWEVLVWEVLIWEVLAPDRTKGWHG